MLFCIAGALIRGYLCPGSCLHEPPCNATLRFVGTRTVALDTHNELAPSLRGQRGMNGELLRRAKHKPGGRSNLVAPSGRLPVRPVIRAGFGPHTLSAYNPQEQLHSLMAGPRNDVRRGALSSLSLTGLRQRFDKLSVTLRSRCQPEPVEGQPKFCRALLN